MGSGVTASIPGRMPALDALRGIAVLLVLAGHYLPDRVAGGMFGEILRPCAIGGVVLFFVLSGYLIERNLRAHGDIVAYGLRRLFRILPAYWIAMAVLLGVAFMTSPREARVLAAPHAILANAVLLQDVFGAPLISAVFWTLILELKFYLVAPFIVRGGTRWVVAAPLVVLTANGLILGWRGNASHLLTYFVFCLTGMVVGLWSRGAIGPRVLVGVVCLVAACTTVYSPFHKAGLLVFAFLSPAALAFVLRQDLVSPTLTFFGHVSYSWYLYHAGIGYPLMKYLEAAPLGISPYLTTMAAVVATLAVAWLSYRVIERPGIALGRTLEHRWLAWRAGARP